MPKISDKTPRVVKPHIYKVEINGETHMVKTTSRARAIKHFIHGISASIATQEELVELVKAGVTVEQVEA